MRYCFCECDPYAIWRISWDEYYRMTSIKRIEYLRSLRLQLSADKEKEKREERYRENAIKKYYKRKE